MNSFFSASFDTAAGEQKSDNQSLAETNLIIEWHDRQISNLQNEVEDLCCQIEEHALEKRTYEKKVDVLSTA